MRSVPHVVTKVIRGGLRKLPSHAGVPPRRHAPKASEGFLPARGSGCTRSSPPPRLPPWRRRGCRPPGTLRTGSCCARDVTTKDVASVKGHWAVQEDRHVDDAPRRLEPLQVIEQRLGTADREGRDDHRTPALSCALNDMTKRVLRITEVVPTVAIGRTRSRDSPPRERGSGRAALDRRIARDRRRRRLSFAPPAFDGSGPQNRRPARRSRDAHAVRDLALAVERHRRQLRERPFGILPNST